MGYKTFLLGVGCQKGGTTWLHDYLAQCPGVRMGLRKEYHVLNKRRFRHYATRPRSGHQLLGRVGYRVGEAMGLSALMEACLKRDLRNYFDHFEAILHSAEEVALTADITPAYAGLPSSLMACVRDTFAARGIRVKVLFLMRDPVERVLSATRMYRRNRCSNLGEAAVTESEQDEVLRYYRSEQCEYLTAYERTIERLESVFAPPDVHYEFYERLFRRSSVETITTFLDLPFVTPDFSRELNVSRNDNLLDTAARRVVFEHYRPTYDYIAQRFGRDLMRKVWGNYCEFGE
ncbi:MAG: sulfotransferase [Pseudazoarcus pumilus]|nr:sulfotransferase [Pseudazoarcus pumilus]